MIHRVNQLINVLNLQAHPEGGFFNENYRAEDLIPKEVLPSTFKGARNFSTAIYYLLTENHFSAFHRIASDEVWHFYEGNTLCLYVIHANGDFQEIKLGKDILNGEYFQYVVKAGCWFAVRLEKQQGYALCGCTVAPGFDFADFEMAKPEELLSICPSQEQLIRGLVRD